MTDEDTWESTVELIDNTLAIKTDTINTEDSGMEEENSPESLIQDEGEDDDEEDVVKKPRNKSKQRLILDDDSDDDSEQCKSKSKTYTRDQVLEAVMAESSDDDADAEDLPATAVSSKSKKIKRPVMDDSSSDEDLEKTDVTRSEAVLKETNIQQKEATDDKDSKTGSCREDEYEVTSPSKQSNVGAQTAGIDSSGSNSTSGSDSEDSDRDNQENEDEGFNEDALDPKLLAKLKKGAAKKPREKSERISKKEEMMSLHSESQRIVREGRVNLPYHQPAPKSLNDFLARANKKQQEYRSLRGAVRDSRKAKVIEGVLQSSRLQVQKKTQAETDNGNTSDRDDSDGENQSIDERKSFLERVSDRLDRLKKLDKEVDETDDCNAGEGTQGHDKVVLDERISVKNSEILDASFSDKLTNNDFNQETEDLSNGNAMECEIFSSTVKEKNAESVISDKDTIHMEETNGVGFNSEQDQNRNVEDTEVEEHLKQAAVKDDLTSATSAAECKISELPETENLESVEEDMLYDWEKPDGCGKDSTARKDQSAEMTVDTHTEDKENLHENSVVADTSTKRNEERISPLKKSSPSTKSDKKLKREKLLALVGIDLNVIKPCLSGETESFVSLVEEEENVPQHPGIVNLMDRLTKHTAKQEKKHSKDLDISIVSKDKVGMNKEELQLNTFTYHIEEEDSNPLLKLETPGAKLVALKEQLKEKMKVKREVARQKRQEIYDLDNEEGDFGAEEDEMSDHSDTDVDDEEFDEEFGEEDAEEVDEDEEEGGMIKEKVREKNPFADEEAAEDGDDEEELEDDCKDGDDDNSSNENDNENNSDENDDEMNLKLDVSDEEEEDGTCANNPSSDKPKVVRESSAETRDIGEFKEPSPKKLPEKPFSIFGQRSRDNSFTDSQIQSGQKPSSLRLQIEDSQDLYGTLPQLAPTQEPSITQSSPQSFNFLLEDSQSVMLDADGYLKTKSTAKKPSKISSLNDLSGTSDDMGDVLGLCSGKFVSQLDSKDKSSKKSLFEDSSMSNTQNMEELMGLCSGVFTDKDTETQKQGTKRKASSDDDHDEHMDDLIEALSDNEERISDKEQASDDEDQGDTDHLEEDGEEEEDEQIDQEEPKKFSGFLQKKGKVRKEFVEEEAELSGSEFDSDENLDLPEEEDIMELEEADKEMANVDQEKLRDEVGRVHLKQLIDEDKRELLRFQEMYLADGDLHSEGGGRIRRFRWNNMDDDTQQDMFGDGSDGEGPDHEDTEESQWRKERYEREKFLKEQQEKEKNETEDSQFLKFGQVFLKKQGSVDGSNSLKDKKDKGALDTLSGNHGDTPGFPASFYKLSKQKRGSFLARSKEALAKIAEMTKPISNPSAGAKSSGKFTFQVISPDKEKSQQAPPTQKQRIAHKPPQNSEPGFKKPPQKKQKLETTSTAQNSIFNHLY